MIRFIAAIAVLLAAAGSVSAADTDMAEAEALYIQECSKCHGKNAGRAALRPFQSQNGLVKVAFDQRTKAQVPALAFSFPYGPSLQGIVGRKAGTAPQYQYSKAFMKYLGGAIWMRPVLDAYLTNSQAMAPGIIMFYKQPNPEIRRKIIDYLEFGG